MPERAHAAPDGGERRQPVDVVITWVNGSSPEFRSAVAALRERGEIDPSAGLDPSRFRDNGELRYALRSIDTHMPWVRHVHLVTSGELPSWLDPDHHRLRIVTHDELFPSARHLPTFNSRAIGVCLPRVPGVAERCLYLNDDMFLGRPREREDFFPAAGGHVILNEPDAMPRDGDAIARNLGFNQRLLDARFGPRAARPIIAHAPYPFRLDWAREVWQIWRSEMDRTLSNRFRAVDEAAPQILYYYTLLESDRFDDSLCPVLTLDTSGYRLVMLRDGDSKGLGELDGVWLERPAIFCINDDLMDAQANRPLREAARELLEAVFPEPSGFERRRPRRSRPPSVADAATSGSRYRAPGAVDRRPTVLILTPVKDAADCFDRYCELLDRMTYPRRLVSIGLLESDSSDGSYRALHARLPRLARGRRSARLWKRDFDFRLPPGVPRWAPPFQLARRSVIARSRNHLLSRALSDEDWVLWIDVDLVDFPPDVVERLLATGRDIVHPLCLKERCDEVFDRNAWRDGGRVGLGDLRDEGELVRLDAVGGTMLWVKADLHRDGLVFPAFPYGQRSRVVRDPNPLGVVGELDTEGLGALAHSMGHQCWGLPGLVVRHRDR